MSVPLENDPEFRGPVAKPGSGCGMSLLKLLGIVVGIMLLIALLLPAPRSAREAARRAQCVNDLKQIALGLHNYVEANGTLPPAQTIDANGRPLHSWRTLLLPYIEEEALYKTIDLSKPWNDPANARAMATEVGVFRCPDSRAPANTTTYLAVVGPEACFLPTKGRRLDEIKDDHGSTLSVIEAGEENAVPWMAPVDGDELLVQSLGPTTKLHHPGGMNAALVDGSVRFLKTSITPQVRRALITISGNDTPSADAW